MKSIGVLLVSSMLVMQAAMACPPLVDEFKLVKQQGNISLYERWIEVNQAEKVRELKAVFSVRSEIPAVVRLFKNPSKSKEWNVNAKEYSVLAGPDENTWITYLKYDIPWPMDDQDCCLSYQYRGNAGNENFAELYFESTTHSRFPVTSNTTRITGTKGRWILQKEPAGNLTITYLVKTDRSKKIPRWMSDPIVHNNLFKTITSLKNMLENNTHE